MIRWRPVWWRVMRARQERDRLMNRLEAHVWYASAYPELKDHPWFICRWKSIRDEAAELQAFIRENR